MGKKILVFTDFDSSGSGYKTICAPLFSKLAELEYEIKIIGLMYRGEEHNFPFSVIPCQTVQDAMGIATNLMYLWNPDVIIVAMDIPVQINVYNKLAPFHKKYIAITPLENGPLTMSWAIPLFNMDKVFFISELGKQEAIKTGMKNVDHLLIGVDTVLWHPATVEEKKQLRDGMGIPQDAFVVLTVADNQERKNLWAGLKAISELKKENLPCPIRYVLVTREKNPYGHNLKDLIRDLNIVNEVQIFERGIPQKDLWGLYALSDVYLQPSKAEGLGLPVMDAMASGIPVVATDTGALHELLEDGRGLLVSPEYAITDVWGNSFRHFINIIKTKNYLNDVMMWKLEGNPFPTEKAHDYISNRKWDIPAKQLDESIKVMFDEPKIQE